MPHMKPADAMRTGGETGDGNRGHLCSPVSGWRPAADPRKARPTQRAAQPRRPRRDRHELHRRTVGIRPADPASAASKRSANACRRTASRCRSAPPGRDARPAPAASSAVWAVRQLPKGVTPRAIRSSREKVRRPRAGRRWGRLKNPVYQKALASFATCMRENGVNVPQPNTSGTGPGLQHQRTEHRKRPVQSR